MAMVFNTTFNNISAISWQSVLLEETRILREEKITNLPQVTDKLYHINVISSRHLNMSRIQTHNISGDLVDSDFNER